MYLILPRDFHYYLLINLRIIIIMSIIIIVFLLEFSNFYCLAQDFIFSEQIAALFPELVFPIKKADNIANTYLRVPTYSSQQNELCKTQYKETNRWVGNSRYQESIFSFVNQHFFSHTFHIHFLLCFLKTFEDFLLFVKNKRTKNFYSFQIKQVGPRREKKK